ncbi:MAG: hypothetical protein NTU48_03345 [Legionellales bacterium]|nr:hypothetical protein [Legionellales bacterium]
MSNKRFAERLNAELDEIGMPQRNSERIENFAKFIHIPKFQAQAVLNGTAIPDEQILNFLAHQLEVSVAWLLGKDDQKH